MLRYYKPIKHVGLQYKYKQASETRLKDTLDARRNGRADDSLHCMRCGTQAMGKEQENVPAEAANAAQAGRVRKSAGQAQKEVRL